MFLNSECIVNIMQYRGFARSNSVNWLWYWTTFLTLQKWAILDQMEKIYWSNMTEEDIRAFTESFRDFILRLAGAWTV